MLFNNDNYRVSISSACGHNVCFKIPDDRPTCFSLYDVDVRQSRLLASCGKGEVPGKVKLEGRRPITTEGKNLAGIDRSSTLQGVKTWRPARMMMQKLRSKEKQPRVRYVANVHSA